jgi:hypothetical protein
VQDLYLWTNATTAAVQGIYITMTSSVSARLTASNGWPLSQPSLKRSGSELGTGLLLGITAAAGPTLALSAVGFAFLIPPVSTALAVDMPAIDIDSMQFEPQQVTDSTISAIGGAGAHLLL